MEVFSGSYHEKMSFQEFSVFVQLAEDAEQNQQAWNRPQWSMPTNKIKQTDHRLARRFSAPIVRSFFIEVIHQGLTEEICVTNPSLQTNCCQMSPLSGPSHNKSPKSQFKTVGRNSQWDFKTRTLQSCRKKNMLLHYPLWFFVSVPSRKKDPFVKTISDMVRCNSSLIQIHAPIWWGPDLSQVFQLGQVHFMDPAVWAHGRILTIILRP